MRLAMRIKDIVGRILTKAAGSDLMGCGRNIHGLKKYAHEPGFLQNFPPFLAKAAMTFAVFGIPGQTNVAIGIQSHPVVWIRQVFGGQPPVYGMTGRPGADGNRHERPLRMEQGRCDLSQSLNMPQWIRIVRVSGVFIKIVQSQGF